jgi:hypothetical protein
MFAMLKVIIIIHNVIILLLEQFIFDVFILIDRKNSSRRSRCHNTTRVNW